MREIVVRRSWYQRSHSSAEPSEAHRIDWKRVLVRMSSSGGPSNGAASRRTRSRKSTFALGSPPSRASQYCSMHAWSALHPKPRGPGRQASCPIGIDSSASVACNTTLLLLAVASPPPCSRGTRGRTSIMRPKRDHGTAKLSLSGLRREVRACVPSGDGSTE